MREVLVNIKRRAKGIKRDIFILVEAYKHPHTPLFIKLFALVIVAYAFSPIDLVPDFIPILGYVDDLILIPLGIVVVLRLIPKDVLQECRVSAEKAEKIKKKNWVAGTIILLLWIGVLFWFVSLVL